MAETPIITQVANPLLTVTLPAFEKSVSSTSSSTFLQFEGNTKPKAFRSPARNETWELVAIFSKFDRTLAETFMALIRATYLLPDSRFTLLPGGLQTTYVARYVEIPDFQETIDKVSGITRVAFTATEVM